MGREDQEGHHAERTQSQGEGAGASQLAQLAAWQQANGGFRRLPPTATNKRLINWVNRCRTDYRRGTLNPKTASELMRLGVNLTPLARGLQPSPSQYEEAVEALVQIERLCAEGHEAPWRSDELLREWVEGLKVMATRHPGSPLLEDLKRKLPALHADAIAPELGEADSTGTLLRGGDQILGGLKEFIRVKWRAPRMDSQDVHERQLASWMIRHDRDILSGPLVRTARQEELWEEVRGELLVHVCSEAERREQWHWWSQCVLWAIKRALMADTSHRYELHKAWHSTLYRTSVQWWEARLGTSVLAWPQRTIKDSSQGGVATTPEIHELLREFAAK